MTNRGALGALVVVALMSTVDAQSSGKPTSKCEGKLFKEEKPETVKAVQDFWRDLQDSLRRNDQHHLAVIASYPLNVSSRNRNFKIRNEREFLTRYEEVFPSYLREMLIREPIECVGRVGWRGFSVSEGQIWFDQSPNGKFRFVAVNSVVPPMP